MTLSERFHSIKIIIYIIRKSKWLVIIATMIANQNLLSAQNLFTRNIDMSEYKHATLQTIFAEIANQKNIHFSYNSSLLDLDSTVQVKAFNGMLIDYMENLLGSKYFFKESGKHLIITYAPKRLDAEVDWKTSQKNKGMIVGVVRDVRTNKKLPYASVYDRLTFQSATLSDDEGYFELNVKHPEQTISITLSKENYRDTTITVMLPIEVRKGKKGRQIGYYSVIDSSNSIYKNFFGSLFTSSTERLQSMNLGGFFAYSPFQVSLTPGLSTHGFMNSQVVNNFSLNIIGGSTAGVDGFEMAGIFNVNQFDVKGGQVAGAINVVGGNVEGIQLAGLSNVTLGNNKGIQIAGMWNNADTLKGFQLAGALNMAKSGKGTQLAGGMNSSKDRIGNQIAGGINIAKKVNGIQLAGLLNIADSSDYPIAVLNLIKNGKKTIGVQIDESRFLSVNFRSGGRVLYSNLGIGTFIDSQESVNKYGVETGLGAHLINKPKFSLAAEVTQRHYFDKDFKLKDDALTSFRVIPAIVIANKLQLYVAPSFNYSYVKDPLNKDIIWKLWGADKERRSFHGGLTAGINFVF